MLLVDKKTGVFIAEVRIPSFPAKARERLDKKAPAAEMGVSLFEVGPAEETTTTGEKEMRPKTGCRQGRTAEKPVQFRRGVWSKGEGMYGWRKGG